MPLRDRLPLADCGNPGASAFTQGMIAASALILFAEAATACTPFGMARLGGGATAVHAITTFDPAPFKRLEPTTDIRTIPTDVQQADAEIAVGDQQEADQPVEQCEAVVVPIA